MKTTKAIMQAIVELESRAGFITEQLVVDQARDPASPLHAAFEWDDSKAADLYRLQQAGELIRSVRVQVQYQESYLRAPRFVSVEPPAGRFRSVDRMTEDATQTLMRQEAARILGNIERTLAVATDRGEFVPMTTRYLLAKMYELAKELVRKCE